jgi:cell wall-associated NlpC family hydrolase
MERHRAARPAARRAAAILLAAAGFLSVLTVSDVSAQDVESLRARADKIAAELDRIQAREQQLTQEYLRTGEELDKARAKIDETEAGAAEAQSRMDQARQQASSYMVSAFIGAGSGVQVTPGASDPNQAVNQQVLLETLQGNRQQVADVLRGAKLDLDQQTEELARASDQLSSKQAEQKKIKDELEAGVARQQELLDGANAELQAAIQAEQERRAAEAEARVRAEAEAQAARAAAAQQAAAQQAAAQAARTAQAAPAPGARTTPQQARTATTLAPQPGRPVTQAPPAPKPTPAPPVVSGPNPRASAAISAAMSQLGLPYLYGGSSPATGFDCSGLTSWAWARAGVSLPRTAAAQYGATQRISVDQLQPGDLVFFSGLGHVGMYIGGGQMVHSPRTGKSVEVVPIFRGGFSFVGAGRVR